MTALFFIFIICLLILFIPLNVAAGITADIARKTLFVKAKLFNFIKIADKAFIYKNFKIIDRKSGKPIKISAKKSGTNVFKAFKIKKARVLVVFPRYDLVYTGKVLNLFDKRGDKFCFYLKCSQQNKLICMEGIISFSLANIIFRLLLSFGEFLWKQLKTKSKKSSTA